MALVRCDDCGRELGWVNELHPLRALHKRGGNYCHSCKMKGRRNWRFGRKGGGHPRPDLSAKFRGTGNPNYGGKWNRGYKGRDMTGPKNPMFGKLRPDFAAHLAARAGKTYADIYGARAEEIKKKILSGLQRKPNFGEVRLAALMPPCVQYVGDYSFWIRLRSGKHKNPDFVVRPFRQERKVIELFGGYWHQKDEEEILTNAYREVGVKCLILWDHDVKRTPSSVKARILDFVSS